MTPVECGKFIAKLRKEKSLTQKELAEKIFVTDKAVSKWETGKGYPDVSSLMALSAYFEVSVNELLCGEYLHTDVFIEKADANIISTIRESEKIKRKHTIQTVFLSVIFIILLFPVLLILLRVFVSEVLSQLRIDNIFSSAISFFVGVILLVVGMVIKKGNVGLLHSYHYENVTDIEGFSHEIGFAISLLCIPIFVFSFMILFGSDIVVQVLSAVLLFAGVIACVININRIQVKYNGK